MASGWAAPDTRRAWMLATLSLTLAAWTEWFLTARRTLVWDVSWKWRAALGVGAFVVLAELGLLVFSGDRTRRLAADGADRAAEVLRGLGWFRYPLLLALALALPAATLGPTSAYFQGVFARLLLFWVITAGAAALLTSLRASWRWHEALLIAGLCLGVVYRVAAFLPEVSAYPFSLGWSEGSRYYYASLFFSGSVYGEPAPPPVQHPSRYLIQSLPFLFSITSLWVHRLWQVLLWVVMAAGTAVLLAHRLMPADRGLRWSLAAWGFLFLFQGPVYYHLLVCVAIVLIGFSAARLGRTSLFVLAASVWAGISRLNWFPVPGLLAAVLYLLEVKPRGRAGAGYLRRPALWIAGGTLAALASQAGYVALSGAPADRFATSLTSQLLWYRLLPSATYPLGILAAVALVSAPIAFTIGRRRTWLRDNLGPVRGLWISVGVLVLLVGGLVVSVKIGGGSNLHNLDAYFVLLAIVGGHVVSGRIAADPQVGSIPGASWTERALALAVPLFFVLQAGRGWFVYDPDAAQGTLDEVRRVAEATQSKGESVLFISQRHLLTFDSIEGVRLLPQHELVFLMEMAMSRQRGYLDAFHRELNEHAYGLIVVEPLKTAMQGAGHAFGEENDAWVQEVSIPILCAYEPIRTFEVPALQLLVPRVDAPECPG
jgi:hypothetical protein